MAIDSASPVDKPWGPSQGGWPGPRCGVQTPSGCCDLALRSPGNGPVRAVLTVPSRCGELVLIDRRNGMEATGTVSMCAEVPEPLLQSMQGFIEAHPNWDQYRLFQAALAGFLVQNGVQTREITRCYLANLFPQQSRFSEPLA